MKILIYLLKDKKKSNIYVIEVLEREEKLGGAKNILDEIMVDNF